MILADRGSADGEKRFEIVGSIRGHAPDRFIVSLISLQLFHLFPSPTRESKDLALVKWPTTSCLAGSSTCCPLY